jgi:uncharacterized membrane protein
MELLPEWAPNIHPLLVHFPIAFLILAFGFNLCTFFVPENWWDEKRNTLLYSIGAVSAIAVYYSGKAAADSIFLPTQAQTTLSSHADWATWTVWFFAGYAIIRILLHWRKLFDKRTIKIALLVLAVPGIYLIFETAEYGGKMVYGYGAGTGQLLSEEIPTPSHADTLESNSESSFVIEESGNWNWDIRSNGVSELIQNFHWTKGSIQSLSPKIISGSDNSFLNITASENENTFVSHGNYKNIELDIYLNMDELDGEIQLIHHYQNELNYDFVTIQSNGKVLQGRVSQSETTIFEESSERFSGMLFVRVVANDTHFRGYINKKMIVHGHGDAPNPGAVGLTISGTGSILIDKIKLTQL